MAQKVFKSPLDQANALQPETTRSKWNRYFNHIGDGNPRTIDKYNRLIGEIESELPFADQKEHDEWSNQAATWNGDPKWINLTEELLTRAEATPIDYDENQINAILKKAKADFPNSWEDEVDYIRQTLGKDWNEHITQVYPKHGYLYGSQSWPNAEPTEVALYKLKK